MSQNGVATLGLVVTGLSASIELEHDADLLFLHPLSGNSLNIVIPTGLLLRRTIRVAGSSAWLDIRILVLKLRERFVEPVLNRVPGVPGKLGLFQAAEQTGIERQYMVPGGIDGDVSHG